MSRRPPSPKRKPVSPSPARAASRRRGRRPPHSCKPDLRHTCALLLLAGSLLLQRSDAQNTGDDALPNYSFRVTLPPVADQKDRLSLPELPLYDRDNYYLRVRDSSKDWYEPKILRQDRETPQANNQTFASELQNPATDGTAESQLNSGPAKRDKKYLLDPEQRILPDLQAEDVLLDNAFVPIPMR